MSKFFVVLALAGRAFAEDAAPKVSSDHLAEYYRADGQVSKIQSAIQSAQTSLKEAQDDLKTAVEAIQKDCGSKHVPSVDPANQKKIVCVVKPASTDKK